MRIVWLSGGKERVKNHPEVGKLLDRTADKIIEYAKEEFLRRENKSDNRVSETSPPRYVSSFYVTKVAGDYRVGNDDPGAAWVEFGSHAGGTTLILKYRPLGKAVQRLSRETRG